MTEPAPSRRDLLSLIGVMAGAGAMMRAAGSLGVAQASSYAGPVKLMTGAPKGASVLVLGAGLAGMTAALELRQAGYQVRILEYNNRPGGRNWTIRGGDRFTELGGATQVCGFDKGLYFNPGPWRIPYHHHAVLDYCRRFGVALEPFTHLNYNAWLHAEEAFGGKPQRVRTVRADFQGQIAELLAKTTAQGRLDAKITPEDQEILLDALRSWGALDKNYRYRAGEISAGVRGFRREAGGGPGGKPEPGQPIALADILRSGVWRQLPFFDDYDFQTSLFQPVGGMDMIGKAFAERVGDLITYNAKVTRIQQSDRQVTVTWEDAAQAAQAQSATADWCVCTIPLPILAELELNVGPKMLAAIKAVPYIASVKVGLQFSRRFWEEDDRIYGGVSYTDMPIALIGYPNSGFNGAKGVLLGANLWNTPSAYEMGALPPDERVRRTLAMGAAIHPQYRETFENGVAVAWHRVPFTMGCSGNWSDEARAAHYDDLCAIDGRIVLAGEHASYLPAWQEGAILSALDASTRLHRRAIAT